MTFDEWATAYFGHDVDVPQACRDAWKAGQREALLEAIEILVADEAYNVENGYGSNYLPAINALKQMAKELE